MIMLEWTYTPENYFESHVEITRDHYVLAIGDGKAEAKIDDTTFDADPEYRQKLHDALDARFLGAQLLSHKAYELSKPRMTRVDAAGRRHIFLHAEPAVFVTTFFPVDFRVTDQHGNVRVDTGQDRNENTRRMAELISAHINDPLLFSVTRSYRAAVRDPNNELVHLYEIRDALAAKLGGKAKACAVLGVEQSAWDTLGRLCNDEPLRQGRHRGRKVGTPLRDATESELQEARRIARTMIENYAVTLR